MKRKHKKAERLNSPPCKQRIIDSFGNFDTNKVNPQNQTISTLAQELKDSLERYRSLRRVFEAEIPNISGGSTWRL